MANFEPTYHKEVHLDFKHELTVSVEIHFLTRFQTRVRGRHWCVGGCQIRDRSYRGGTGGSTCGGHLVHVHLVTVWHLASTWVSVYQWTIGHWRWWQWTVSLTSGIHQVINIQWIIFIRRPTLHLNMSVTGIAPLLMMTWCQAHCHTGTAQQWPWRQHWAWHHTRITSQTLSTSGLEINTN